MPHGKLSYETSHSNPLKRKALDQVRDAMGLKHYSYQTDQSYVAWTRRYVLLWRD